MTSNSRPINWPNTLFLFLTPLVGIGGAIWMACTGHLNSNTLWLTLIFTIVSGLSVTAGYHRLFSHRAYKAAWPVRLFFLLFGAAAFEGSVLEWSTDHRRHHLYVDTDRDPYNINQGFWYAHMGWLLVAPKSKDYSNVKDLESDPLARIQHKYIVLIASIMGFIFPMAIASLWGDALGGFIIAGALRIAFNQQLTFCVNSVCHYWGNRQYSKEQTARDNWFTALFTYGEGFHNFHHKFMFDYRNGIRFYHFDPAKWLIRSLAFVGLAKDLKSASPKQIQRFRMQVEEQNLFKGFPYHSSDFLNYLGKLIKPLQERILQLMTHLEEAHIELQQRKREYLNNKTQEYRQLLHAQYQKLSMLNEELKHALGSWAKISRVC